MPGRSFEEQVRDELAGLNLVPDAVVWQTVEASLQKDKKRRWLIWLFVLLAGLGITSLLVYEQLPKAEHLARKPVVKKSTYIKQTLGEVVGPLVKDSTAIVPLAAESAVTKKDAGIITEQISVNNKPAIITTTISSKTASDNNKNIAPTVTKTDSAQTNGIAVNNGNIHPDRAVMPVTKTTGIADTLVNAVPVTEQPNITKTTTSVASKTPWQWNVSINAGISGFRKSFAKLTEQAVYYSLPSTPIQNNTPTRPTFKDAFSFGIVAGVYRQLDKKFSIAITGGYELYQTKVNVGQRIYNTQGLINVAGSRSFQLSGADTVQYINHYHFLNAGFDLYRHFTLFSSLNLRWQLGLGINVLLASNGLHFNKNTYLLHIDRDLLNTVGVNASTGFDIGIGKRPVWYIGPQLGYFINNISKQPDVDQHLFRYSLRATYVLPKKTKTTQR